MWNQWSGRHLLPATISAFDSSAICSDLFFRMGKKRDRERMEEWKNGGKREKERENKAQIPIWQLEETQPIEWLEWREG